MLYPPSIAKVRGWRPGRTSTRRPWKEHPLSTKTATPSPATRRERRLAERAGPGGAGPNGAGAGRRRGSPMLWTTVAVGVVGIVVVATLLVFQGGTPKAVDVAGLQRPSFQAATALVDGRALGKADAPVTLEVWSDFQCPACGQFAEIVEPVLVRKYVTAGTLRIVIHDAAFQGQRSESSFDESVESAAGARCAMQQDAFWPFHDWLFANQAGENQGAFRDERLRAIATGIGLDVVAWDACRATGEQQAAVRAETKSAVAQGVNATPTLILDGKTIAGLRGADELGKLIEAAAAAPSGS